MKTMPLLKHLRRPSLVVLLTMGMIVQGHAQSQIVSVKLHNVPLGKAIKNLAQQSKLKYSYSSDFINVKTKVSVTAQGERLDKVLDRMLQSTDVRYKIVDGCIMFFQKKQGVGRLQSGQIHNDNVRISGVITDEHGSPVIGATVSTANGSQGTVSDVNGLYTIVVPRGARLTFSYIGYDEHSKVVTQNGDLNIVLKENSTDLSEIVVVGYGTQKKVNLTGAVSMIKGDVLESRPIANVTSGLQGELPGVNITSSTGKPGSAPSIVVRGVSTINSSTAPLILIDGVAGGDINMLNPDDIASVSVLKDAASASIYGARAANGVVLITTKTGHKNEKPTFSYNGYVGYQTPTRLSRLVSGREYMELANEAMAAAGYSRPYSEEAFRKYDSGEDPNEYSNTDWIDQLYKKSSFQTSHNISVRGGNAKSGYSMSYGYLNQDGLVVGNPYKSHRHNARIEVNTEVNDRLTLTGNASFVDFYKQDLSVSGTGGVFRLSQRISPLLPVKWKQKDESGQWTDTPWYSFGAVKNPIYVAHDAGHSVREVRTFNGIINARFKIIDQLSVSGLYSNNYYTRTAEDYDAIMNNYYQDGTPSKENENLRNQLYQGEFKTLTQSLQATINYNQTLARKHELSALIGVSQEWEHKTMLSGSRKQILVDGVDVLNGGTEDLQNAGNKYDWALRSYFGRINYAFDNKYLLEANMRIDGTSRFAKANRWGYFPSVSAGWNFAHETFMRWAKPVLHTGKLRMSWGELGNQNVASDYYPYLTSINRVEKSYPIGGETNVGFKQIALGNAHIKWETIKMFNVGIDLSFFNNRLSTTFEWYLKKNTNALVKPIYPTIIGVTGSTNLPFENIGEIENKGWEWWIQWQDRIGEIHYKTTFNISDSRNKITDLGKSAPTLSDFLRKEGEAINAYYGYRTKGLAQMSDFGGQDEHGRYINPKFYTPKSDAAIVQPGDIIYEDVNGDKVIDDKDKVVLGDQDPHYIFSFKASAQWKMFDLSFYLQGVGRWNGYLSDEARHCFINDYSIPKIEHLDRWTPTNPNATYPRLYMAETHNRMFSDYWIENASYLRMKNIQAGFTFPKKWLKGIGIKNLRCYVSADNLFTVTQYFGAYDPELHASSGDAYPQVKTFIFGVQTTF